MIPIKVRGFLDQGFGLVRLGSGDDGNSLDLKFARDAFPKSREAFKQYARLLQ